MNNPVHPEALIREDCLAVLETSIDAAAAQLGVTRQTLRHLVNA